MLFNKNQIILIIFDTVNIPQAFVVIAILSAHSSSLFDKWSLILNFCVHLFLMPSFGFIVQ